MIKLLTDLRLLQTETNGEWIVAVQDRYFSVSSNTAALLSVMTADPGRPADIYAKQLSSQLGYAISADDVTEAISGLPDAFFAISKKTENYRFSMTLIGEFSLERITKVFSVFFNPHLAFVLIALSGLCSALPFLFDTQGSVSPAITALVVLSSIFFHELGHASACKAVGARATSIGLGIKRISPIFYTDVSDVWTRGRAARLTVDSGGVYFQLVFAGLIGAASIAYPGLKTALLLILMLIGFSILPYYRFDGYWMLVDWLGVNKLSSWLRAAVVDTGRKLRSREFDFSDIKKLAFLFAYAAGLVALNIWFVYICYILVTRMWGAISTGLAATFATSVSSMSEFLPSASTSAIVLMASAAGVSLLRRASRSVQIQETWAVLVACLKVIVLWLILPILHLRPKHRRYLAGVEIGLRKSNKTGLDIRAIAKRTLIAKYYEMFWFDLLSRVSTRTGLWLVRKTHKTVSRDTFQSLRESQGPTMIIAPHFGSFISGALYMLDELSAFRRVHVFYADPKTDPANARYESFYRRYFPDVAVCFDNRAGVVHAAKALKNGEVVAIMPDVFSGKNLVNIELFGKEVGVRPGISYFHRKFGASMVPVVSNFSGLFNINVSISPSIILDTSMTRSEEVDAQVMGHLFKYFEGWFSDRPDHWHCWERFGKLCRPLTDAGAVPYP